MTIGIAVYNLLQSAEDNIRMVETMGRHLGLKIEPIRLRLIDEDFESSTEISIRDAIRERRLPIDYYSVSISDIKDYEYVTRNTGASVSFVMGEYPGSLDAHTNSLNFASFLADPAHKEVLALAKGRYGFVVDWKSKSSFWEYACGFEHFDPLSTADSDELADTPAGWWGVECNAEPVAAIEGKFRDIYEVNLITDKQLERAILGSTVRNLLRSQKSSYGELSKLAEDWYEWVVPHESIAFVRREFLAAGLLDPRFVDETIT